MRVKTEVKGVQGRHNGSKKSAAKMSYMCWMETSSVIVIDRVNGKREGNKLSIYALQGP